MKIKVDINKGRMEDEADPIRHFLYWLSPWDGKDRTEDLAGRIVNDNEDWAMFFHKWLLQTVALWMDDTATDEGCWLQPVLTETDGEWGWLYSLFVVPPELRDYFITHNTEFRRRSGNCWIKTSTTQQPITSAADMRRLVCIAIDKPIQLETPIDHTQLFAQIKQELDEGAVWKLNDEETERLVARNALFQDVSDLRQMILATFRSPVEGEKVKAMKVDDIIAILAEEYPNIPLSDKANQEIGNLLKKLNFERKRINTGSAYVVVKREEKRKENPQTKSDVGHNPLAAALLEGLGNI